MSRPHRILLVEDDGLQRMALCDMLADRHGYDVVGAGSLGAARAALGAHAGRFAAIVLDVGLPDGDGRVLCAALREAGYGGPIVILTGDADAQCGLAAGASRLLRKPVRARVLADTLRDQIGQAGGEAGRARATDAA